MIGEYLRSQKEWAADLLCELIKIKSTPGSEQEVQSYIRERIEGLGFDVTEAAVDEDIVDYPDYTKVPEHKDYSGRPNLIVNVSGSGGERSAILNSHSDVVPGHDGLFEPVRDGDVIIGRGACDAKGQVAAQLLLLKALSDLNIGFSGDLQVQIVIEEESGGNGSLSAIRQGNRADIAVVMEPTGLNVHPANRGAVWFRLSVTGKPTHMARYWEGVNAIDGMVELIGILHEYEAFLREESRGNPLFADGPSPISVNIGQIQGGEWPSMVASECCMEGGIAFLPNRRISQIFDEVRARLDSGASDWVKSNYSFKFGRLRNEAFETPVDHPAVVSFADAAAAVNGRSEMTGFLASCDARLFYHRGGMPVITFGPGNIRHAHALDEQIALEDIVRAAEVLIRFFSDWCGLQGGEI